MSTEITALTKQARDVLRRYDTCGHAAILRGEPGEEFRFDDLVLAGAFVRVGDSYRRTALGSECARLLRLISVMVASDKIAIERACGALDKQAEFIRNTRPGTAIHLFRLGLLDGEGEPTPLGRLVAEVTTP